MRPIGGLAGAWTELTARHGDGIPLGVQLELFLADPRKICFSTNDVIGRRGGGSERALLSQWVNLTWNVISLAVGWNRWRSTALERHHRIKMLATGVWKAGSFRWKNRTDVRASSTCCVWQMRILTGTETRRLISESCDSVWRVGVKLCMLRLRQKWFWNYDTRTRGTMYIMERKIQRTISKSRPASDISIRIIRSPSVTAMTINFL